MRMYWGAGRPGREQNLIVSHSKHWYAAKDGTLRYQQKDLDERTCGPKKLLTRFIVSDVDTGTV